MRNKLLLTTALAALALALPAEADTPSPFLAETGKTLSGVYEGYANKTGTMGGVVAVAESVDGVTVADGTAFKNNNTSVSAGGAIKALDSIAIGKNVKFFHNQAQEKGWGAGAIYLRDRTGGTTTIGENAVFEQNSATAFGGALGLEAGNLSLGDGALFNENSAANGGAVAIWTDADNNLEAGSQINLGTARYTNNKAQTYGGAIANLDVKTAYAHNAIAGEGSVFENNSAHAGGAIYGGQGTMTTLEDNVSFVNNNTFNELGDAGGALYITEATLKTGNNVLFSGNKALSEIDPNTSAKGAAGAIYAYNSNVSFGDNAVFENNESRYAAGALYNWTPDNGKLELGNNAVFRNNKSMESYGGAIGNFDGNMTIGENAVFEGNSAGTEGGAIANKAFSTSATTLAIGNGATFANNTAATNGGAIYNDSKGTIELKGNATFANNKAGDKLNDIHNAGMITVAEGSALTLDGGISGDGTAKFGANTVLNVKQGVTEISNKVITAITPQTEDSVAALSDAKGTTVNVTLKNGADNIDLNDIFTNEANKDNLIGIELGSNALYNFVQDEKDSSLFIAEQKSSGDVAAALGVSGTEAAAVLAVAAGGESGNAAFDTAAAALNDAAQNGNGAAAQEASKLGADANPIVRTIETDLHNMVFAAVGDELNGAGGTMAASEYQDAPFKRVKAWVRGLFNHVDKEATSKAKGFDANIYGVAMGIDKQVDRAVKFGAGYAYNQADVSAHGRDTDVDTHTAFVYGQYKPSDWHINTIVAYNWSDYDEKKSVLGTDNGAKYDVSSIGAEVMSGYEMQLGGYSVTPEAGLRYAHISQDAYHDRLGNRVSGNDSDILTAVIGTKAAKNFALDGETAIRPEIKAAMTYDLVDDGNNANVALANGAAYRVNGEKLERLGFELGAKAAVDVAENVELSAGYELRFRKDYNDQTAMLNVKYIF